MPYKDFEGFWKVKSSDAEECPQGSLVTFDRPNAEAEEVTILCVKDPSFAYGEGTGKYKKVVGEDGKEVDTIEVKFEGNDYVISLNKEANPPKIDLKLKGPVSGQVTGTWTAEDYVPGSKPAPADE